MNVRFGVRTDIPFPLGDDLTERPAIAGPTSGRYKGVRGGSWKSKIIMLRTATRSGFSPDQRSATIGFRCAQSSVTNEGTGRP